jgi:lysophospholipase L1-like esterase
MHCVVRLSNGILDGTFKPEQSNDAVHPNDAAHDAIAAELVPLIRAAADLD